MTGCNLLDFGKPARQNGKRLPCERLMDENAKLRELSRALHMAYVETLNECESLNDGLIWECSGSIDDDIAKSRVKFEVLRHRFDAALCELGIEVSK